MSHDHYPPRADADIARLPLGYRTVVRLMRLPVVAYMVGGAIVLLGGAALAVWLVATGRMSADAALSTAGVVVVAGLLVVRVGSLFSERSGGGPNFIDIDRSARRPRDLDGQLESMIDEVRRIASTASGDRAALEALVERMTQTRSDTGAAAALLPTSFQEQMRLTSGVLEEKAKLSDEKASVLLDRGVGYSRLGIWLFIASIIVWQSLAAWKGFQTQYVFGIASCAILFVFLQFLSSWFLKQYRHFVEVSTYLLEIKSVFDRYALLHMLGRELTAAGRAGDEPANALVSALKEEMKWPRARPGFTDDIYFAKDAVGASEEIVKIIRMAGNPKEMPGKG